jgi:predicted amidohydrolase
MKVAVAQVAPTLGDLGANLEMVRGFQERAHAEGAELIIFPELAMTGYSLGHEMAKCALRRDGEIFCELLTLSRKLPMVVGFVERSPRGRIYNSAALLDGGEIVHLHRKVYLPTYSVWEEQKHFARGKRLAVFSYRGYRIALFICNDFWYPSMAYLAACDDAHVFCVIANSSMDGEGTNPHSWDLLLRPPALLYGAFVLFANRVGEEQGATYWGGSRVIEPLGHPIATAGSDEEIIYAELDPNKVERARDALPILRDADIEFTLRELEDIATRRVGEND